MTSSSDQAEYSGETLLKNVPVYQSRLKGALEVVTQGGPLNPDSFHMHYNGSVPLESALSFFGETGVLLDLGCGYGGSVVWFAQRTPAYKSYLGVDLVKENIDIANTLAARYLKHDSRVNFLAHDIARLNPDVFATYAGSTSASAVLSLNTLYHLTADQRIRTWRFLDQVLTSGGRVYIEDFVRKLDLDHTQRKNLAEGLGCPYLPDRLEFVDIISKTVACAQIWTEDISDSYIAFSRQRYETYDGDDAEKRLFYEGIYKLLSGGYLGGIRVKVIRP